MKKAIAVLIMLALSLSAFACVIIPDLSAQTDAFLEATEAPESEQTGAWIMTAKTSYSVDRTRFWEHTYELDEDGRIIRSVIEKRTENESEFDAKTGNKENTSIAVFQIKYDKSGRVRKVSGGFYGEPVAETTVFSYNRDGSKEVRMKQPNKACVWRYNERGDSVLEEVYDGRGAFSYGYEKDYEYDTNGRIKRVTKMLVSQSGERTVESTFRREYDSEGRNSKELLYDADGNLLATWDYYYDDNGNQIQRDYYDVNGNWNMEVYEWTYDPDALPCDEVLASLLWR